MFARITGIGAYIPERRVSNVELEKIIPTSDAWIQENIGVVTRSVIAPGETIADMGRHAAREALTKSDRSDIGLVICATNSPDTLYPATACRIAHELGLGFVPAFDLQAGCTGFLYALAQAKPFVETAGKSALVIGSDALSTGFCWGGDPSARTRGVAAAHEVHPSGGPSARTRGVAAAHEVHPSGDRNAVLFGDGAGAVVLSPSEEPGILAIEIGAEYSDGITLKTPYDSALSSPLHYLAGESERRPGDWYTKMNGRAIMKLSLTHVPKAMDTVIERAGLNKKDVSVFLPHQTNKHVIRKLAEHIGFPTEKIPDVLSQYGSLSTAVIPVSMHMVQSRMKDGDNILITAYGAGFTYGAAIMRL